MLNQYPAQLIHQYQNRKSNHQCIIKQENVHQDQPNYPQIPFMGMVGYHPSHLYQQQPIPQHQDNNSVSSNNSTISNNSVQNPAPGPIKKEEDQQQQTPGTGIDQLLTPNLKQAAQQTLSHHAMGTMKTVQHNPLHQVPMLSKTQLLMDSPLTQMKISPGQYPLNHQALLPCLSPGDINNFQALMPIHHHHILHTPTSIQTTFPTHTLSHSQSPQAQDIQHHTNINNNCNNIMQVTHINNGNKDGNNGKNGKNFKNGNNLKDIKNGKNNNKDYMNKQAMNQNNQSHHNMDPSLKMINKTKQSQNIQDPEHVDPVEEMRILSILLSVVQSLLILMTGIQMSIHTVQTPIESVKKSYQERTIKSVDDLKILTENFVQKSLEKMYDLMIDPWRKNWGMIQMHIMNQYLPSMIELIKTHPLVPTNATSMACHYQAYRQIAMEILQNMKQQTSKYRQWNKEKKDLNGEEWEILNQMTYDQMMEETEEETEGVSVQIEMEQMEEMEVSESEESAQEDMEQQEEIQQRERKVGEEEEEEEVEQKKEALVPFNLAPIPCQIPLAQTNTVHTVNTVNTVNTVTPTKKVMIKKKKKKKVIRRKKKAMKKMKESKKAIMIKKEPHSNMIHQIHSKLKDQQQHQQPLDMEDFQCFLTNQHHYSEDYQMVQTLDQQHNNSHHVLMTDNLIKYKNKLYQKAFDILANIT